MSKRFYFLSTLLTILFFGVSCTHNETKVSPLDLREGIREVILGNLSGIKACYDKALNDKKSGVGSGKLTAEWTITTGGIVEKEHLVKSEFKSPDFHKCILSEIHGWKFKAPPGKQVEIVRYPFVFAEDKSK